MAALHADAFPTNQAWSSTQFEALLNQESISALAITKMGDLVAGALVQIAADQAEILTLATARKHRRQGLAKHLLTSWEAELLPRGVSTWLLDVAEDNHSAVELYKNMGFKLDGRRPGYYKRNAEKRVDALLMSKPMARQAAT